MRARPGRNPKHDPWLDNVVAAPLDIEYLLTFLFGKNRYHGFAGIHRAGTWRTHLSKVFGTLSSAVHQSMLGDDFHRREVERLCSQAVEQLRREKRADQIVVIALVYLTKIAFSLVGEFPDHWNKRAARQPRNWRLNRKRALVYVRTPEQRIAQILDLTRRDDYRKRLPTFQGLARRLWKVGAARSLEWFEQNYPEVAQELK